MRPRRRWWRWALLAGLGLTVAAFLAAWLMFQYVPDWYRPPDIPADSDQPIKNDIIWTESRLTQAIVNAPGPFEYRFTQEQVNAWLAIREGIWPEVRHWLPPGVSDPFIAFQPDRVCLAATCRRGNLRTVLSAHLALRADEEAIYLQLMKVSAGALAVPGNWVRRQLASLDAGHWPAGRRASLQIGGPPLPHLVNLPDSVALANRWIWKNGERPFRITGLKLEQGALTVTFEPLPR